jgi:methanogenic corrinoid protein MtbC1
MAMELSIGALAQATGVPADTLRTWERRYGFPAPSTRTEGTHRRYPIETVERIRLVLQALDLGHKPSVAVPATPDELQQLLSIHGERPAVAASAREGTDHLARMFATIQSFDAGGLQRALQRAWNELGAERFLEECAGPFLTEVGERWERGEIEVAHEHFASEQTRAFLATQWALLSERATGPTVVCATPPGEQHVLGLHLAAAALVAGDARIVYLGASTPADDVLTAVAESDASAVALSATACAKRAELKRYVAVLRDHLPKGVTLIVGGRGFRDLDVGAVRPERLGALTDWARTRPRRRRA